LLVDVRCSHRRHSYSESRTFTSTFNLIPPPLDRLEIRHQRFDTMAYHAFNYDENLFSECAGSSLAAFVASQAPTEDPSQVADGYSENSSADGYSENSSADDSCILLFQQHAAHYGRQHSPEDEHIERASSSSDSGSSHVSYRLGKKIHNFVRNVSFVFDHNSAAKGQSHRVALNQFSDLRTSEVIRSNQRWDQHTDRHLLWENKEVWEYGPFDADYFQEAWAGDVGAVTSLSSSQMIRDVAANLAIGKGSLNKLKPKHRRHKKYGDSSDRIIEVPFDDPEAFEAPSTDDSILDGALMSLKESKEHRYNRKHPRGSDTTSRNNTMDYFETYLDWATTNNPDGVAIVHDPFDQVSTSIRIS
jgi:hypothetical protein